MKSHLMALEMSLSNQVLDDLRFSLAEIPAERKILAARSVVDYLLKRNSSNCNEVELSLEFATEVIRIMIFFVNQLITDRVMSLRLHSETIADGSFDELNECDTFLRSLRGLQNDMENRESIHAGTFQSKEVIRLPSIIPTTPFSICPTIDQVIERSLMTGNVSHGIRELLYRQCTGEDSNMMVGSEMRSIARLIAYIFFCSQQMDSFFVGLNILRQSGQHVSQVLREIYKHTSIRFVRDRIALHLSHGIGRIDPLSVDPRSACDDDENGRIEKVLKNMEIIYTNNCYFTEINRLWSTLVSGVVLSKARAGSPGTAAPIVDCGNISDIFPTVPVGGGNRIGNITLDESNNVLRCISCSETRGGKKLLFPPTVSNSRGGYMHMTVEWISKMKNEEINQIFMDSSFWESETCERLQYYVSKNDWKMTIELLWSSPNSDVKAATTDFMNQVVHETLCATGTDCTGRWSRNDMAKVGGFLGDGAKLSTMDDVIWTSKVPQLELLYLRRFELGKSLEEIDDLIGSNTMPVLLLGRLGIPQLPYVSKLMPCSAEGRDLVKLCEYMYDSPVDDEEIEKVLSRFFSITNGTVRSTGGPDNYTCLDAYSLTSFKGDISVRDLICDVYPSLDIDSTIGFPGAGEPGSSSTTNISSDIEYYLAQGRPAKAFMILSSSSMAATSGQLQLAARRVAFYNLFNDGVVASAISFLDLCGESTEMLRVDIQSARAAVAAAATDRRDLGQVVELFLHFTSNHSDLLSALKLLEEAAWMNEPPTGEGGGVVSGSGPSIGESPWHLVALFCRVHNLPRSLTLLHELARNGDWVMLLHESDLQQCPIDTVRDVVCLYFAEGPLRSHLNILVASATTTAATTGGVSSSDTAGTKHPRTLPSSTGSGLESILVCDPEQWWTNNENFVLRERKQKLFNLDGTDRVKFERFVSKFQFTRAAALVGRRELIAVFNGVEGSLLFQSEMKNVYASIGTSVLEEANLLLMADDEDIGTLNESSFTSSGGRGNSTSSSSSGVLVESMLTDDEDDAILLDQIRAGLMSDEECFDQIAGGIDHEGLFKPFYGIIVNYFDTVTRDMNESEYLELVSLVAMDCRILFGRFLIEKVRGERGDVHIVLFAYYMVGTSFDEDCLEEVLGLVRSYDLPILVHHVPELQVEEMWSRPPSVVSLADALELETKMQNDDDPQTLIQSMGTMLKISRVYNAHGCFGKHLEANASAVHICTRLRDVPIS